MRVGAWRHWLKRFDRRSSPAAVRARPPVTLKLEVLEDRTAPAVFTVTSATDSGTGTGNSGDLLYCVTQSNLTSGANTIQFALPSGPQTIDLSSQLVLSDSVTINAGNAQISISGDNATRVFMVNAGVTATLDNLTITAGMAQFGGGIWNAGNLTLSGCTLSGNQASGGNGASLVNSSGGGGGGGAGLGGAIFNTGTLTLVNCTVSGNLATGGQGGSITANYSAVNGGLGGGVNGGAGGLGNASGGNGSPGAAGGFGGGGGGGGGTHGFANSPPSGPGGAGGFGGGGGGAGGSPFGYGGAVGGLGGTYGGNGGPSQSSHSGGGGGGAGLGGALFNDGGTISLTNCTVAGNSATGGAGGNSFGSGSAGQGVAGGIFNDSGSVQAVNTILSGNTSSTNSPDVSGSLTGNFNLVGGNADLGPLQANGGPTFTMAPSNTSPAIGGGTFSGAPATDQRGQLRLGWINIGAYQDSFVVTTTADSGAGSLRVVIGNANADPGSTITFDIPGSGVQTITPASPLPNITSSVVIDGLSQPGAAPGSLLIELNGSEAGPASGLTLTAANSTVEGLVINGFESSGVLITGSGATGNVLQSNDIGTDPTGEFAMPNLGDGVVITNGAADNVIGGSTPGAGNLISGNDGAGVAIGRLNAAGSDNQVLGNLIGTDASGLQALGNALEGVLVNAFSTGEVIGGTTALDRNVIGGNGLSGVRLDNASQTTIIGNYIGVGSDGSTPVANLDGGGNAGGVSVLDTATGNIIGEVGAGNLIAFNSQGVLIEGASAVGNSIQGNSISATAGPGIDLSDNGNDDQPFPVITSFDGTTVTGYLNGSPGVSYDIELFASPVSGPAHQGATFLSSTVVTADSTGLVTFSVALEDFPQGAAVTATATDLQTGDTSEFSNSAPASYVITGDGQQTQPDTAFATPLTVQVLDAYGNPIPGITVTFTSPNSNVILSGSGGLTDGSGDATVDATAGTVAGTYPVVATVSGLSPYTFTLTINPGPPPRWSWSAAVGSRRCPTPRLLPR